MICRVVTDSCHRQTGVGGQYEIDPKLNEGHAHQFHDVKRSRAERRKMHGGECECCKEVSWILGCSMITDVGDLCQVVCHSFFNSTTKL